ncbi:hypothetical protein GGQ92_003153 [Gracilibacillus halotolerans]|uniref:Uncharacterized protein n=1 Tax=Gracilibacillus halotolerans TaxID=74386 RepID=A0A841RP84_9BACI|nr:hypothetical protein [Gracilibacillus halotolerans]
MISLLLILFACSSESEPITLDINQPIQLIVAQKVENNTLSESAQQFITDENDISNILSIINKIDYESYNHDNLPSKLEDHSYYSLAFFKKMI